MDTDLFGQPVPVENDHGSSWDLVITDMQARDRLVGKKYGMPLQPLKRHSSLKDLYEDLLDAVVYLRSRLAEEELKRSEASELVASLITKEMDRGGTEFQTIMRISNILCRRGL